MRVTLNCHRAGHAPGDVVDLPDDEVQPLLAFGAAHRLEEPAPATTSNTDAANDAPAATPADASASKTAPAAAPGKTGT